VSYKDDILEGNARFRAVVPRMLDYVRDLIGNYSGPRIRENTPSIVIDHQAGGFGYFRLYELGNFQHLFR